MMSAPYRRQPHWEAHLARLVAERERTPFAFGAADCVTFAADAVQAMTGVDPIAEIRGGWSSAAEAQAAMDRFAGRPASVDDVIAIMAQRQGWPEVAPPLAGRGDLALLACHGAHALGVVTGERAMHPGLRGLVATPMHQALRAWVI